MPDQIATPAASVPRDSHQTANNIVKGITERSNGKAPAAPPAPINEGQKPPVNPTANDANAGKEKYVVEGREVWLTPDERTKWIQKGMAFEPRMDQLARLQHEQVQLQRALLNDPGKVLANLAVQAKVPMQDLVQRVLKGNASEEVKEAVGKWYYDEAVEPLKLSPEEKKAREDAKWRQEREGQDKLAQEASIRQENQRKFQSAMGDIKAKISEAMKDSGLPDNNTALGAEMARLVADVMRVAYFKRENITPKQAIEYVKKHRIQSVQNSYYAHLKGKALADALGEQVVNEVKTYLLDMAKGNGNPIPVVPIGKQRHAARHGDRETINLDQFHEALEQYKK